MVITMATTPDSRQPLLIGVAWMVVLSLAWFVTGVRRTASAHARTGSLPAVAARE